MKTTFYIVLNMKRSDGFEAYGRFFIGNDHTAANLLFSELQGSSIISDEDILHMDLMETVDGLPVNMKVINCRLDELTANCRIVTKHVFKLLNLEEMGGERE